MIPTLGIGASRSFLSGLYEKAPRDVPRIVAVPSWNAIAVFDGSVWLKASSRPDDAVSGAMYPWEADERGNETTPHFAAQNARSEIHITGDVAVAQWQYYLASGDSAWLAQEGFPVIRETADPTCYGPIGRDLARARPVNDVEHAQPAAVVRLVDAVALDEQVVIERADRPDGRVTWVESLLLQCTLLDRLDDPLANKGSALHAEAVDMRLDRMPGFMVGDLEEASGLRMDRPAARVARAERDECAEVLARRSSNG